MKFLITEIDKTTGVARAIATRLTWEGATDEVAKRRRDWCEKTARRFAHKIEFMSEVEK